MALSAMTAVLALQMSRPAPAPTLTALVPGPATVPGSAPVLPWPPGAQAAVSVPGAGLLMGSGTEAPVPVASLTKIMTAYVVLRDHPLRASAQGPMVTMTAADQQDAAENAVANATSVPVVAGQLFSERQLLDGLIVHSANDFADTLARWDAGSLPAFVAKMNATAGALGMHDTHYVDPSGIDQSGTSTALDQLRVTDAAMALPAFAVVADQPTITVAGVGTLANYVPAVGTDGVVGVKSGFTQAAMGCVVLAAERPVAGRRVVVLAAVIGQQGGIDPIRAAQRGAIALVDAAATGLRSQTVLDSGRRVAMVTTPWAKSAVALSTASGVSTLVWPREQVRYRLDPVSVRAGSPAGAVVGRLEVIAGDQRFSVPVRLSNPVMGPSMHWRFTHR